MSQTLTVEVTLTIEMRKEIELPVIWTSPTTAETIVDGETVKLRLYPPVPWEKKADGDFSRGDSDLWYFNFVDEKRDRIIAEWLI